MSPEYLESPVQVLPNGILRKRVTPQAFPGLPVIADAIWAVLPGVREAAVVADAEYFESAVLVLADGDLGNNTS